MFARILATLAALLIATAAYAETLVVYPLTSRDSFIGALVADRIATGLGDGHEVYGPAVAPSLVPPLPIGEGFLNPTEFLRDGGVANRTGTVLLRDALGADAVLTGDIVFEGDRLVARLLLASRAGTREFSIRAPADQPARLAARAIAAVARRLGTPVDEPDVDIDMSGPDGVLGQALALIAAGLIDDARRVLEGDEEPNDRSRQLLQAMREIERDGLEPGGEADPALLATLAVNRDPLDERLALHYFQRLAEARELPAAALWVAVLETSVNDLAAAERHFGELPGDYPYGQAAHAAFLLGGGADGSEAPLERALESEDVAALLGVAAAAGSLGDIELEKVAWARLGRVAPFFTYPFERLSFIAFDQEDALAAAEALAVAVELEPESDLYWTNLGWAYYLLGMLEKSERASERAIELAPGQYIAQYNLGLVQAVKGRLEEANASYLSALRSDPEVDDAAIDDLEQALELFPDEPAVHYALAMLYEAEGRRSEAAEQFRLYVDRAEDSAFRERASERVEILSAPPPPIELTDGVVTVRLGSRRVAAGPYHPGDPLYPSFEVYTPGEELPQRLDVTVDLSTADGESVMTLERPVEVPRAAVAFVVNDMELALPRDLQAGPYRLTVVVRADEGRDASATVMFEVAGQPQLLRQLLGRNLQMQALDTGVRLYGPEDLARPQLLTDLLLAELQSSADAAEQALPAVEAGRFAGMTGGELFRSSTGSDVNSFLEYLLASGARDASFIFAEAYAQWALEGAPDEALEEEDPDGAR
ncbi:MAG: tetratricopeptide repeat protein [Trueperaceae bacterium]